MAGFTMRLLKMQSKPIRNFGLAELLWQLWSHMQFFSSEFRLVSDSQHALVATLAR